MVKSYSVGSSSQASPVISTSKHFLQKVGLSSNAPQLRNPTRTKRSGEAVKNLAYLMTSSFDAGVGGVSDRGPVVIGGLLRGKTHVIL